MPNRCAVSLVLAVAVVVGFLPTRATAVDEYVMSRIECPQSTTVKLNWSNKIGSEPSFSIGDEGQELGVPFKTSSVSGQIITCRYETPTNPALRAHYRYDVKRQILGCTSSAGKRVLECKLKK
jgi:hypothetical protein